MLTHPLPHLVGGWKADGWANNPSYIQSNQKIKHMNVNQDKITHYLTLRNKADMEIEATGWVSEETDDALEAIELTLTPQEMEKYRDWETVQ